MSLAYTFDPWKFQTENFLINHTRLPVWWLSFNKWTAHQLSKTMRSQMNFCHMTFSFKQKPWKAKWTYYAIWRSLSLARALGLLLDLQVGAGIALWWWFLLLLRGWFSLHIMLHLCSADVQYHHLHSLILTIQILVQALALFIWIQSWCQTLPGIIMLKHIQHLTYGTIILDIRNLDIHATWSIPVQWQGITALDPSNARRGGLAAFIVLFSCKDIFSMASTNWQSNYVSLHLKNHFKRESNYEHLSKNKTLQQSTDKPWEVLHEEKSQYKMCKILTNKYSIGLFVWWLLVFGCITSWLLALSMPPTSYISKVITTTSN